jgi:hypothetical protein
LKHFLFLVYLLVLFIYVEALFVFSLPTGVIYTRGVLTKSIG